MSVTAPPGHFPGKIERRFADVGPSSYNQNDRTVEAVLSMGSPVTRFYGTEKLRIHPDAVDLSRLTQGGIPVLDSHQQTGISNSLGRVTRTWFNRGALMGELRFHATPEGRKAEGMVSRGEVIGVSVGYAVHRWEIRDGDGDIVDPEKQRISFDDNLTFEATRWTPHEISLVSTPADPQAVIRSLGSGVDRLPISTPLDLIVLSDARARMAATQRMIERNLALDERRAARDEKDAIRARMAARQAMIEYRVARELRTETRDYVEAARARMRAYAIMIKRMRS